jgi:hypothetical protein
VNAEEEVEEEEDHPWNCHDVVPVTSCLEYRGQLENEFGTEHLCH